MWIHWLQFKAWCGRVYRFVLVALNHGALPLAVANTEAEREQLYLFRYKINFRQLPPHSNDNIPMEPNQESTLSEHHDILHLYLGPIESPQASIRCLVWDKAQLTDETKSQLGLGHLSWINQYRVGQVDQVVTDVRYSSQRNRLRLITSSLRYLSTVHDCQIAIVSCKPGEIKDYLLLGLHPYTSWLIDKPEGAEILLAIFLDKEYCRAIRSPLWFAGFKRNQTKAKHWSELLKEQKTVVLHTPKIQAILSDFYAGAIGNNIIPKKSVFELCVHLGAYLLKMPHKTKLIAKNVVDEDTYFLISGYAFIQIDAKRKIPINAGGFIEDFSHLMPFHRRQYDIYCDHALVLVLNEACLYKMRRYFPYVYQDLLISITRQNQLNAFKQRDQYAVEVVDEKNNYTLIKPKRFEFGVRSMFSDFLQHRQARRK